MLWQRSHRFDERSRLLADRHYNRRKIGSPQFMPPGRCCVFYAETETGEAFWGSAWPFAQYVRHAWAGAWMCTAFRNEGAALSSDLIIQAVAATRAHWGEPPALGMVTFVDTKKTRPKRSPGYCYLRAGFIYVGETKAGLKAFQLLPSDMPPPEPCRV